MTVDPIGAFLARLHHFLGHDKAAAFIGQPAGDKSACVLCQYEQQPNDTTRRAVIRALTPPEQP